MGTQTCIDLGTAPLRRRHPLGGSPGAGIVITHGLLLCGWLDFSERGIVGCTGLVPMHAQAAGRGFRLSGSAVPGALIEKEQPEDQCKQQDREPGSTVK